MAEFDPIAFNLENVDRHLLDYLPPFLQRVQEFQAINAASEPEVKAAWQSLGRVLGNQFLTETDGHGLAVWERELGVFAKDTDTLALRRARIKAAWQRQPPYTLRWLRGWLHELCGAGNYALNVEDYTLNIQLAYDRLPEPNALLSEILNILQPLRPANMRLWPAMTAAPVVFQTIEHFQPISLQMPFYFSNQPNDITLLNGRRSLDGSWKLDSTFRGVVMRSFELYMAWQERQKIERGALLVPGIVLPNRERSVWSGLSWHDRLTNRIGAGSKSLGLKSNFDGRQTSAMAGGSLTKDTMWRLDGSARLDGSKKLNAAIIKEMI